MKLNLLALTLVALPLFTAQASNTVVSNFATLVADRPTSHPAMLSDGSTLIANNTGVVVAGYFTMTDAQLGAVSAAPAGAARQAAWAAAAASFVQFGATSGVVGGGGGLNNAGLYKLTAGAPVLAGSPFIGKNIYTVIGNGATILTSSDIVLFKSNNTFAPDPTPEATGNFLGNPPAGTLVLGSMGAPGTFYNSGLLGPPLAGGPAVTTTPVVALFVGVPEPTTALLGVLSLGLGFIRRRR